MALTLKVSEKARKRLREWGNQARVEMRQVGVG